MTPQIAGLIVFGLILAGCILAIWLDRPKRNRRVTLPPPYKDNRSSLELFRAMYPPPSDRGQG